MEAKTNYTLVGLAVIILFAGLIISSLWLSVGLDQKTYKVYAVHMNEGVSGLSQDSAVKYNGVQVGTVFKIQLSRVDPQEVEILLNIEEGTPITTSTTATLISQGITGTTYVGLTASSSDLTPLQKNPEEPYPIIPSRPSLFNQLDSALQKMSDNINGVGDRIKSILDDENSMNLKKTLANLDKFSHVIAANGKNIDHTLKNSDIVMHNMAKVSKELPSLIRELKASVNKLSSAGINVSKTMKAGKIAINKVSEQTVPPAVSLLRELNTIAANLDKVSVQMRQNPSVLLRGTKPPSPGPGE